MEDMRENGGGRICNWGPGPRPEDLESVFADLCHEDEAKRLKIPAAIEKLERM